MSRPHVEGPYILPAEGVREEVPVARGGATLADKSPHQPPPTRPLRPIAEPQSPAAQSTLGGLGPKTRQALEQCASSRCHKTLALTVRPRAVLSMIMRSTGPLVVF
ncbi:hypothetical protein J6590_012311 [Homalodisca vitripennis]|nr:hypothetical protein J6590_012311 [Homalodisca vitripennis]